jgi:membrane protein CcdC involved in cytochrome C biogenesis
MAFMATVVATSAVLARGATPPLWVTYSPLLPPAPLMGTGLYMFVQPYFTKWRSGRRTA